MQTIEHSGIFFSHFTDEETSCVPQAKEHYVTLVEGGELEFQLGKKKIFVRAGECVFLRRNHKIKFFKKPYKSELYKGVSITLSRENLREFYQKIPKSQLPKNLKRKEIDLLKIETDPKILAFFESISPYYQNTPTEVFCKEKIQEIIGILIDKNVQFYPTLFDFSPKWKIDLIDFMEKHFAEDLSQEDWARYTGRSLATFKRDFSKISGLTPQKWLIQKRLNEAYELIFNQHKKAREVYLQVGFKEISHFYRCFKEYYGVLPSQ